MRGLHKETPNYRGARVGNVFHGSEGYVVLTSYTAGAAFDKDGKKVATFNGGGDHHGNFIKAMRSREYTDLHADVLEGHLSSSLCHLANISYRTGQDVPFNAKSKAFGDDKEAAETFARMQEHLKANEVPMDGATYHLGKKLAFDAKSEKFTNDSKANALLTREYRKPFVVPKSV